MQDSFKPLSLVVGFAFFMEQLDSTIIAPAIPDIAASFHVAPLSLNLTLTVYLLCSVAFIPAGGQLAARWGTRSVFRGSLLLFVASSLACALARNLPLLASARALQGTAAALMVPVGRIAMVHAIPRQKLVLALAWMITPAMLGPLLGPPLGGLITSGLSWHWIFLVNVPVGLLGWAFAARCVPQVREAAEGRFDGPAWALLVLILGVGIVLLEAVRRVGLHPQTGGWVLLGLAALAGLVVGFTLRSRRVAVPLLDFGLLRGPTFNTAFWAGALVRVGYGALPFLLPLMMQIGMGYSAVQSGLALLASGAVAFATKTQTASILRRFGFRRVLIVNGLICALGLGLCALFRASWGLAAIALVVSVAGFSRSIQFNALAAIAYADMPTNKVAAATTLNTMVQQLAVLLGISLAALLVDWSAHAGGRLAPVAGDFGLAFLVLASVALAALPSCIRLKQDAGSELSGHRASA